MLGTGFFLKIAKINPQQEKPICPNRIKISSRKRQKITTPQKIYCRKNFVPHGNLRSGDLRKKNRLIAGYHTVARATE